MSFFNAFAFCYDEFSTYDYDAWAEYIRRIFERYGLPRKASVLDAACGTGSITLKLSEYSITGMDQSEEMLAEASEKARRLGLNIPLIKGNLTDIELHRPVDAIIVTCDGINYLLDDDSVANFFRSAYANLKPQGLLAFDISSRFKIENILANQFFAEEVENAAYIWQNAYDMSRRILDMDITLFIRESGALFRREHEFHCQKAYDVDDIISIANACRFSVDVFDGFSFKPVGEKSERIQFVCRPGNKGLCSNTCI